MKILIVIIFFVLSIILCVKSNEEEVIITANSVTDLTCFDSSCSSIKTEEVITETSNILTEDSTSKTATLTTALANKNGTDYPKKNDSSEVQSKNKFTNNKGNKTIAEAPRRNKTKQKPKPKEEKIKNEKIANPPNDTKGEEKNSGTKTKQFSIMKSCNCDSTSGVCEINCCCDEDCTKGNKQVFAHCEDESNYISRSDYCFSPNVIYRNNTPYRTFNMRPGLLCIAKDNLPDKIKYYTHKVIESKEKVETIITKRKVYQWKNEFNEDLDLDNYQSYSFGSPVWILQNVSNELSLHKLRIVHEGITSLCKSQYQVGYLENFDSSCLVKGPSNEAECQNSFDYNIASYTNLQVLISPHLVNSTNDLAEVSIDETFSKLKVYICSHGKCVNLTNANFTKYNYKTKTCDNVIKEVRYTIKHNGTNGIYEANCYLVVDNINLNYGMFRQKFEIKYIWLKASNVSFPRSGKPGYLSGKPLIIGNRTEKMEGDIKKDVFVVSNDSKDWLTIATTLNDGLCSDKRSNILFNDNIRSECRIKIEHTDLNEAENCSALWDKVTKYFYGKTDDLENIWLSAWGDPRLEDTAAWVPLIYSIDQLVPTCSEFISAISYKFLYSLSGPLSSPNTKLVGAMVQTKTSPLLCESIKCTIPLITTVTFTSVTATPKLLYPKHPALRIHLPKDFFYPFSSSSKASCILLSHIILSLFLILFISTIFF